MLYNPQDGLSYDFYDDPKYIKQAAEMAGMQVFEFEVPTWNVAVVLNNRIMYNDHNPLKFDRCPFVPIFWNYDPHLTNPNLRVRSLVRSMRDIQFLMNRRIIINHDISESSINTGFIRMENMLVDEDCTKKIGQGNDIVYKEGYDINQIQKVIPNSVPPADLELSNQLADLIFKVSGVSETTMGYDNTSESGFHEMLRQGANLVTLQKYFDQWDVALKQIGVIDKEIMQYNWSYSKVARILGREPSIEFKTKIFSRIGVLVEEGLNTTIQQQQNFVNLLQLNEALGGAIPKDSIIKRAIIHDKKSILEEFNQSQQQQSEMAQHQMTMAMAKSEAEIQKLQASSVAEIAMAKERDGRQDSNVGLWVERQSEAGKNRSMALKNEVDALGRLSEILATFGDASTQSTERHLDNIELENMIEEDKSKMESQALAHETDFDYNSIMDKIKNSTLQLQQGGQNEVQQ
jgi:hypothetical protein